MKTLLVLRHAKSSWADSRLDDHERPLNERGREDAPRIGRLLREKGLVPERVISSTAVRAVATAETVAAASDFAGEIEVDRRLYLAPPEAYIARLRMLPVSVTRVMVVGHNPGIGELVAILTGHDEHFPTAALAQVALPIEAWETLSALTEGRLVHLWRPKNLRG